MKLRNKKTGEIERVTMKASYSGGELQIRHFLDEDFEADSQFEEYHSLAELNEGWEDVPAEPLIKDEKIRKAVRAWADGNNIESVHYDAFWRGFRRENSSITVWEELPLEDNEVYTIDELCGKEEE